MTDTQTKPMLAQEAPSQCRSSECGAFVVWRRSTATGKAICLDADPVEKAYVAGYTAGVPAFHYVVVSATRCRPVDEDEWCDDDVPVYVGHWRTCRAARQFAKGRSA